MNYAEYIALTEKTEINQDLYRALLKDVATASIERLKAILNVFISMNVPEDCDGDVDEIKAEGLKEVDAMDAELMAMYAELIWMLPISVSEALFHSLEQLYV